MTSSTSSDMARPRPQDRSTAVLVGGVRALAALLAASLIFFGATSPLIFYGLVILILGTGLASLFAAPPTRADLVVAIGLAGLAAIWWASDAASRAGAAADIAALAAAGAIFAVSARTGASYALRLTMSNAVVTAGLAFCVWSFTIGIVADTGFESAGLAATFFAVLALSRVLRSAKSAAKDGGELRDALADGARGAVVSTPALLAALILIAGSGDRATLMIAGFALIGLVLLEIRFWPGATRSSAVSLVEVLIYGLGGMAALAALVTVQALDTHTDIGAAARFGLQQLQTVLSDAPALGIDLGNYEGFRASLATPETRAGLDALVHLEPSALRWIAETGAVGTGLAVAGGIALLLVCTRPLRRPSVSKSPALLALVVIFVAAAALLTQPGFAAPATLWTAAALLGPAFGYGDSLRRR